MARPAPGLKKGTTTAQKRAKAGVMASIGFAFKAASSDVAATRGVGPKVSKAAKYSYLIGKEVIGLLQVIPYGVHAMLTHSSLPSGKEVQQNLVEGLGQVAQHVGLANQAGDQASALKSGKPVAVEESGTDEVGSAVDFDPRSGATSSGAASSSLPGPGWGGWASGWFRQKSAYSASMFKNLRYGDQERETLDVFTPTIIDSTEQAPEAHLYPVVLFVHGGVWSSGEKWQYAPLGARLAHEGCVAAVMQYSLYPEVLADEQSKQVSQALDWIFQNIARFGGQPDNVTLVGHSSGAHICSLAVYQRAKALLASHSSPDPAPASSMRQPRAFVGLAGVYDIGEHLKFEQWRGVAALSCMTPANGGPEGFSRVSAVRLFEALAEEVGISGSDCATSAGEEKPFLGEATEASRAIRSAEETQTLGRASSSRPWKEWPFSPVVDQALARGGRLTSKHSVTESEDRAGMAASDGQTDEVAVRREQTAGGQGSKEAASGGRIADAMPLVVLESSPADTTVPIDTSVAFARTLRHIGCRVKSLVYDNAAHPDFVIWPRKFEGDEALGLHIRDLLRVVKSKGSREARDGHAERRYDQLP